MNDVGEIEGVAPPSGRHCSFAMLTPASGGPLGLGRPGLHLMARWARPFNHLSGSQSLTILFRLGARNNPNPPLLFTTDPSYINILPLNLNMAMPDINATIKSRPALAESP